MVMLAMAADQALRAASLPPPRRGDFILGTTLGGMELGAPFVRRILEGGAAEGASSLLGDFLPAGQPHALAEKRSIEGRVLLLNNACSSGTDALGMAYERIRRGEASRVFAGGYDPLCSFVAAGFKSLMHVSTKRCRPFDKDRDGLVLGEG
ncbi:MAG: beta-ketoacyl synthase N-terminal-like domain-containing protein, partial [Planctomycetota bacterium]